jgi:hypothetical protein
MHDPHRTFSRIVLLFAFLAILVILKANGIRIWAMLAGS